MPIPNVHRISFTYNSIYFIVLKIYGQNCMHGPLYAILQGNKFAKINLTICRFQGRLFELTPIYFDSKTTFV